MPSRFASPPTTLLRSPSLELVALGVAPYRGGGMRMMLDPQANLPNFFEDFSGYFLLSSSEVILFWDLLVGCCGFGVFLLLRSHRR